MNLNCSSGLRYLLCQDYLFSVYCFQSSNDKLIACRYTTDGGSRENLEKGTISGDAVFSGKAKLL